MPGMLARCHAWGHAALALAVGCGLQRIELEPASLDADGSAAADAMSVEGVEGAPDGAAAEASRGASASGADEASPAGLVPPTNEGLMPAVALEGAGAVTCSEIDLLFVIDNSLSMAFAQDNLRASFPGLLDVLGDTLPGADVHVMVVDTDGRDGDTDDVCDVLGAGRRTNGQNGDDCGLPGIQRFASGSADLEPAVACMSSVGTRGEAREQQADALLAALAPEQDAAGACNAGFSRPEALLVVTLITNTDDDLSVGDPDAWRAALVAHKGGNDAAVVMVGFLPGDAFSPSSSGVICNLLAEFNPAPRLEALVTSFADHQLASVCEADYGPTFAAAVRSIARACDGFVPNVGR